MASTAREPAPSASFFRADHAPSDEALAFSIVEGRSENVFVRAGRVAAHVVVTSGDAPRVLFAFPAGNAGAALWLERGSEDVELRVVDGARPVERPDGMRGAAVTIAASTARVRVIRAALGSIRSIRRVPGGGVPPALACAIEAGPPVVLARRSVDGRNRLAVMIEPLAGTHAEVDEQGRVVLESTRGSVSMRVTALADDAPLTPIPLRDLVRPDALGRARELSALAFLAYEEKLLAGSWRFLTYFGRDTLIAARLLEPVLGPRAMEAALGSVLDRLAPGGDVAHEEEIGEWAALHRDDAGDGPASPRFDYAMIDDDFLLAPLAASYLLDDAEGSARAERFLARRTPSGETYRARLLDNLGLVLRLAAPYAEAPDVRTLVALKPGRVAGEWRDSAGGLGGGRIPWNVNAVLVPAALMAAARLFAQLDHPTRARDAQRLARAWTGVGDRFAVTIAGEEARARVKAYAASIDLDARDALASLDGLDALTFPALALDEHGAPIPVMHSDEGFALLYGEPPPRALEDAAARLLRPFPAGLRTPIGVVVANPALAPSSALHAAFTTAHYHGTVIWSWQHAMLAAGLRRQQRRVDLPQRTHTSLALAERALWETMRATAAESMSELWTFRVEAGRIERMPFGQARDHHDESNAVQLWSTALLALEPPEG